MPFARILPWPSHILFAIIEPLMAIIGGISTIASPEYTITDQIPPLYQIGKEDISPGTLVILHQLANTFGVIGLVLALVLWTSNPTTARYMLVIVGLGDLGHIYASYAGMGPVMFWDVGSWNAVVWMNVGVSLFLLVNRVLTLLGVWGKLVGEGRRVKKE